MSAAEALRQAFGGECREPSQLSPLVLAYVGDTVYDLFVRTMLVNNSDATVHGMHVRAAEYVCAAAQAAASERVSPLLNEKEQAIFRRARNAHIGTIPKNASIGAYRAATGLEAVVGYLYLLGEDERLKELMRTILERDAQTKGEA